MRYAICLGRCNYCGYRWRPIMDTGDDGGFTTINIECPFCHGGEGQLTYVVGFEEDEDAAIARAEALSEIEH